jgi:predicted transposase/invertase (TIGR01784 family)
MKLKNQDVIFYLLMELQSTVDFTMPFRLLSYMIEIWRDLLIDTPPEDTSKKDFRLPAIVPIVLYNGENNWTAPTNFKEMLLSYEEFDDQILNFSYSLIDVNRYEPDHLKKLSNLIGSIFLLDQKYDIIEINDRLTSIADVLQKLDSRQFHHFTKWFTRIICSNISKENLDHVVKMIERSSPEEVEVVISNLAETLKKAQEEARRQGIELGFEKGHEQGLEQGRKTKQIEIVKNMIQCAIPLETIAKVTNLPLEDIQRICDEIAKDQ